MKFATKIYLPAIDKTISVSELEYYDFITLQKYLINNDNTEIEKYFDYLITKYIDYKGYIPALDKFIILIFQRINSLHADFEVMKDNNLYKVNLSDFINTLIDFEKRVKFPLQRISDDKIDYYINLPSKFSYKIKAEFIYDWIHTIMIREEKMVINRQDFNNGVLSKTPAYIAKQLEMIIDIVTEAFAKIPISILQIFKNDIPEELTLDLSNGILLELLKVLLKGNLIEWYEKNHFLLSKGGHKLSDLYLLSPAEVNTFYKMVEEELSKIYNVDKENKTI